MKTTFIGDMLTVIRGRVCIPLCPATGRKLRDSFHFNGSWYIPERSATLIAGNEYSALIDIERAKRLERI